METCLAEAIDICLKTFASDELILATYLLGETIGVTNIVKDGEVYDEQFLVKVDAALFVDWIEIDGLSILHNGIGGCYCACPVDLVQSAMLVLHDEEEETLIVAVELYQREQNVEIRVAQTA